jgi:hypothetical protein
MRIRTTKPEFWSSWSVGQLTRDERLLFKGLWNYADDHGKGLADPRAIKGALFPFDDDLDSTNVRRMIDELSRKHFLVLYSALGKPLFKLIGWHHQKIDRPQLSKLPDPDSVLWEAALTAREQGEQQFDERSTNDRRMIDDDSLLYLGIKGSRDQVINLPLEVFENAENPKSCSPSAQTSKQASMPAKPKNEIWDTAHDLATELWPDSPPGTRKGWAGEITKLVKRTGNDPTSLTRLGAAIIGHHGLRGLGQLSNPTRAALMARLPQILNLQPNPQTLADRWATVVKPSRRTDLGGQLELLLTGWDHRPATNDRPWSAAHRQRTVAENYLAKLADALAVTEPSKRRFDPTNQSGPTAIDAVSVLNNLKGTA